MNRKKILHITPHMGGGVGKVVDKFILGSSDILEHLVVNLEAKKYGVDPVLIKWADIVLIHWWNHPLLYDYLIRTKIPPCRVIMWSHISGFHPPYVFTNKILNYPDQFIFTTPISFETKEVQDCAEKQKHSFKEIWSTSGLDYVKDVIPIAHSKYNIGYIGTIDPSKIHPNFIDMCSMVDVPEAHFIVCGGPGEEKLKKQAEEKGISDKFTFTGFVRDIKQYLSIIDIFGYPLNPNHYGTCDQSLAEAMACGIPPVVFNNRMELTMVQSGRTGIVANNMGEYISGLKNAYYHSSGVKMMGILAKEYALKTYSLENMVQRWEKVFNEIILLPKTEKKWNTDKKYWSSADIFLESLGEWKKIFDYEKMIKIYAKNPLWKSNSKGTVHQYLRFFPEDKLLQYWSKIMKEEI